MNRKKKLIQIIFFSLMTCVISMFLEVNLARSQASAVAPVDFTFLGLTPDKKEFKYRIKVNSDKAIDAVYIHLKSLDAQGKSLDETDLQWANIVKSTRQTIEKKTYDLTEDVYPKGTDKLDTKLHYVVFKDGSRWNAK